MLLLLLLQVQHNETKLSEISIMRRVQCFHLANIGYK